MTKTNMNSKMVLALRYLENFEQGNYAAIQSLLDNEYLFHFPGAKMPLNKMEFTEWIKEIRSAFPGLKFSVNGQLEDSNLVMTRFSFQGIQKGPLVGIPATNNNVLVNGISLVRIRKNKILEEYLEFDTLGVLQQLKAVSHIANPFTPHMLVMEEH